MVRSIVAVLVSRGMATESGVLMQSQASTDAALRFESGSLGSSNVDKMKMNTKAMEDQYKGLLQQIVDSGSMQDPGTGKPYVPDKSFLNVVETQFNLLRDELRKEKSTNEGIIAAGHAAIIACNSARGTAFSESGGVLALQGTMQRNRDTHATCRTAEDGNIADMEAKCSAFDEIQNKCDADQDWYAQFDENSQENPLLDIVKSATECHLAVEVVSAKATECDNDQDTFQDSYCAFANDLQTTCTTHGSCYALETGKFADNKAQIQVLEKDGKAIFRMLGKVTCYVDVLKGAEVGNMPTQPQIDTCNGLVVVDDELNINYGTVAKEDDCDRPHHEDLGTTANDMALGNFRPGYADWYNAEYTGSFLDHNKLNDGPGQC